MPRIKKSKSFIKDISLVIFDLDLQVNGAFSRPHTALNNEPVHVTGISVKANGASNTSL